MSFITPPPPPIVFSLTPSWLPQELPLLLTLLGTAFLCSGLHYPRLTQCPKDRRASCFTEFMPLTATEVSSSTLPHLLPHSYTRLGFGFIRRKTLLQFLSVNSV